MKEYNYIQPTESNHNCIFPANLEDDENVFFHVTLKINFDLIQETGFLPASKFRPEGQNVVSYARRSSGCLYHRYMHFPDQIVVVFAVSFINLTPENADNSSADLYVKNEVQPNSIIGYCELPADFCYF